MRPAHADRAANISIATARSDGARTGNDFAGLWYPLIVAAVCAVICYVAVPETSQVDIEADSMAAGREMKPATASD